MKKDFSKRGRKDEDLKEKDKRPSRRGNSRKNTKKERIKKDESIFDAGERVSYAGAGNDPSWYAASDALLRDAASLPYSNTLGVNVTLSNNGIIATYPGLVHDSEDFIVPGVCAIKYVPCPGASADNASPVNVAARNLYSFVTHAQSGAKNYEAPDLMMYILGMASIYNMWNFLVRIYGVAMTYSQKNRYLPYAILKSMNVDPDSVLSHLADLRYAINSMANKIGVMCVPTTLPIIERWCFMNQAVYLDAPDEKAQIYLYTPAGYYQWTETSGAPGYLEYKDLFQTSDLDVWMLMNIVQNQINAMALSEDCNRMSGDIFKAYQGHVWKLEPIPTEYVVIPTYNEEILMQMENSVALGNFETSGAAGPLRNITQNGTTGAIEYGPCIFLQPYSWMDKIINMHHDEVTPANNMIATRLMNVVDLKDIHRTSGLIGADYFVPSALGSEFVSSYRIVTIDNLITWGVTIREYTSFPYFKPSGPGFTGFANFVKDISPFDWHPIFYVSRDNDTSGSVDMDQVIFSTVMCDLDNYTVIDYRTLRQMHETALLSEFNVPLMGAVTSTPKR